ncbi:hypothetical protein V6N13_076355 [Hibiscus sabdariffa]
MCFTFVVADWEGTAHDSRIFLNAVRDRRLKFPHPPNGKYYLVDSGYPQMKGFLGPYRGQRPVSGLDDADFMEYENNDNAYKDIIDPENVEDGDSDDDGELNASFGSEMELIRDAIACSLIN